MSEKGGAPERLAYSELEARNNGVEAPSPQVLSEPQFRPSAQSADGKTDPDPGQHKLRPIEQIYPGMSPTEALKIIAEYTRQFPEELRVKLAELLDQRGYAPENWCFFRSCLPDSTPDNLPPRIASHSIILKGGLYLVPEANNGTGPKYRVENTTALSSIFVFCENWRDLGTNPEDF